jgi:hypothetical protein
VDEIDSDSEDEAGGVDSDSEDEDGNVRHMTLV